MKQKRMRLDYDEAKLEEMRQEVDEHRAELAADETKLEERAQHVSHVSRQPWLGNPSLTSIPTYSSNVSRQPSLVNPALTSTPTYSSHVSRQPWLGNPSLTSIPTYSSHVSRQPSLVNPALTSTPTYSSHVSRQRSLVNPALTSTPTYSSHVSRQPSLVNPALTSTPTYSSHVSRQPSLVNPALTSTPTYSSHVSRQPWLGNPALTSIPTYSSHVSRQPSLVNPALTSTPTYSSHVSRQPSLVNPALTSTPTYSSHVSRQPSLVNPALTSTPTYSSHVSRQPSLVNPALTSTPTYSSHVSRQPWLGNPALTSIPTYSSLVSRQPSLVTPALTSTPTNSSHVSRQPRHPHRPTAATSQGNLHPHQPTMDTVAMMLQHSSDNPEPCGHDRFPQHNIEDHPTEMRSTPIPSEGQIWANDNLNIMVRVQQMRNGLHGQMMNWASRIAIPLRYFPDAALSTEPLPQPGVPERWCYSCVSPDTVGGLSASADRYARNPWRPLGVELQVHSEAAIEEFKGHRRRILQSVLHRVETRMSSLDETEVNRAAARFIDPREWPTDDTLAGFGNNELDTLCDHFESALARNDFNRGPVRREWAGVKAFMRRQPRGQLGQLVEIVLVFPLSTAAVERGFSLMKRVKADWRSRLEVAMLSKLMFISIEGPSVREYHAARAVQAWRDAAGPLKDSLYIQCSIPDHSSPALLMQLKSNPHNQKTSTISTSCSYTCCCQE
ncbi:ZNF862 [Branchiostoma lanceolatum]|uniref:ZNF862 protein n=1 Tax=Branchiostoma lanceolatum TaxID=7740 RepID=A0A8J9W8Y5_BRALA|nr:ZNF862 [Branchiostoma lanceolatum]